MSALMTGTVAEANCIADVTEGDFIVAAKVGAHEVIAAVANDDRVSIAIVGKHRNIVVVTPDDRCRWWNEAAAGDLEDRAEANPSPAVRPANVCCAEQVAVAIGNQAADRDLRHRDPWSHRPLPRQRRQRSSFQWLAQHNPGTADRDKVYANGSSYDTITLGNGQRDTVNLGGPLQSSVGDTISLGNGAGDTVNLVGPLQSAEPDFIVTASEGAHRVIGAGIRATFIS
jgi:hypothetical protein